MDSMDVSSHWYIIETVFEMNSIYNIKECVKMSRNDIRSKNKSTHNTPLRSFIVAKRCHITICQILEKKRLFRFG